MSSLTDSLVIDFVTPFHHGDVQTSISPYVRNCSEMSSIFFFKQISYHKRYAHKLSVLFFPRLKYIKLICRMSVCSLNVTKDSGTCYGIDTFTIPGHLVIPIDSKQSYDLNMMLPKTNSALLNVDWEKTYRKRKVATTK